MNGDIIEDASFTGHGCAISQASTSMMIDLIKGKDKKEALRLTQQFIDMIHKKDVNLDELGDAQVLQGVSDFPARVKCALLAWKTLQEIL
jgi:nitrogen fixation NifU-like protein